MRGTFKKLTEKGNRKNTVWRGEIAHSYAWGPTARNLWGRWPLRQRNLDLSRYKWYSKKAFVKGSFQSLLKAVPSYLTVCISVLNDWESLVDSTKSFLWRSLGEMIPGVCGRPFFLFDAPSLHKLLLFLFFFLFCLQFILLFVCFCCN